MNTKIRSAVAISIAVVGMVWSTNVYAAPSTVHVPVHASLDRAKLIKLNLRNDSGAPMELKLGEDVVTLAAGKTVAVKLAVGTKICANATSGKHQAGELLAQVSPELNDATIGIK